MCVEPFFLLHWLFDSLRCADAELLPGWTVQAKAGVETIISFAEKLQRYLAGRPSPGADEAEGETTDEEIFARLL